MSVAEVLRIAVVNAGTSDPSTTEMLASRIAESLTLEAQSRGLVISLRYIDLKTVAQEIMAALVSQHVGPGLQSTIDQLKDADGLIVSTPVYKAGASGLFSSFFQVLDNDLLIGTPVILAGTAGSARHGLVVDDQLRGLFSYLRTLPVPTGIFAAPEDWAGNELGGRIRRAVAELLSLLQSNFRQSLRTERWKDYRHSYGFCWHAIRP